MSLDITLNTGQKMPIIGLGTATGHDDVIYNLMRTALNTALECGYRAIDTAYMYFNEEAIGEELQEWFSTGKLKREDIFVTSKLPAIGNRAEDVDRFLTMSLKKLKLDYLDLYLIHHPFGLQCFQEKNVFAKNADGVTVFDYETNLESLWRALEKQVEGGRIRAIGLSNFNSKQIDRILKFAKIPPSVNQVEMHGYFNQQPLLEFCKQRGIVITAYSPMGAPYTKEGSTVSPVLLENPTVLEIAKNHGKTAGQVLTKFLIQLNVTVIPKSVTPQRIISNFQVMDFELNEEEIQKLLQLHRGKEGRVYHFTSDFPGCSEHKEYPFHEEF